MSRQSGAAVGKYHSYVSFILHLPICL